MTVSRPVVPLLVPDLPDRHALMPYLQRMDDARQYSNFGPLAVELEQRLASMFSGRARASTFVAAVSSATLGIELALAALALKPGSRVLVPALTFVATATAVIRAGHVPLISDIDAACWMLTPAMAQAAFDVAPFDAVLTVAAFGQPHSFALWQAFSRSHRMPVIIDAAGAFGSQWCDAESLSREGDPADVTLVFSLHTTKSLPAGEGGLVVSLDPERILDVRRQSNFGLDSGTSDLIGTNAKLSEYHAAVGLASLARWDQRAAVRRDLMRRYRAALTGASRGAVVWQGPAVIAAPTLLCVRWPGAYGADELERVCAERGVMTRRWYQPLLHRHPVAPGHIEHLPTPVADGMARELIGLPFFPDMSDEQLECVAACVAAVASQHKAAPAAQSDWRGKSDKSDLRINEPSPIPWTISSSF